MPLQKSFSEQNHSHSSEVRASHTNNATLTNDPQKKPQWNRNRSFQGPQQARNNDSSKPLYEKPPVPVSTTTKNKLSAFQYDTTSNTETTPRKPRRLISTEDKENLVMSEGAQNAPRQSPEGDVTMSECSRKEVPATPSGKLALPDLIGMGDVRRAVHEISPDDRIGWDPGNNIIENIRKAKKRARSSSPTSSPSPAHFGNQFDPGSELWGRYSISGLNKSNSQTATIPALAYIMHTSSPQPLKQGTTPFRRANSCGNQFPKRRRVGETEGKDMFAEFVNVGPSKLSVLLEKVQEGLVQSQHIDDMDVSISPATAKNVGSSSPLRKRTRTASPQKSKPKLSPLGKSRHSAEPLQPDSPGYGSSDYGEFDDDVFDENILGATAATIKKAKGASRSFSNTPKPESIPCPPSRDSRPAGRPKQKHAQGTESQPISLKSPKAEDDDFGDSDDEAFGADLEDIVAKFDANGTENKSAPLTEVPKNPGSQKMNGLEVDSEDEFGDGIDDFDFAAAEIASTQSIRQTASSLLPVRTHFP